MALTEEAFDEYRHTAALVSQIHTDWEKKESDDYALFQKHYNKRLRELYSLERKVIKESAQHTNLETTSVGSNANPQEQQQLAETTAAMESNVDQLNENQREMAGLSGKPTLNKVAMEMQNTETSEVNAIAKQDAAILKLDNKKTNNCCNNKNDRVQLPLHQYNSYCHLGGINLYYNRQGSKCHSRCPCNKQYMGKPAPGQSTTHDKTATFTKQKNGLEQMVERWKGWISMDGGYAEKQKELLDYGRKESSWIKDYKQ